MSDEDMPDEAPAHIRASVRSVNSSMDAYRLTEKKLQPDDEEDGGEGEGDEE